MLLFLTQQSEGTQFHLLQQEPTSCHHHDYGQGVPPPVSEIYIDYGVLIISPLTAWELLCGIAMYVAR